MKLICFAFTEKIQRMPAIFAPVHELARHIHVINTYCREAEYVRDPLHLVLWEILDDLVESHANLSPKSLFAGLTKLLKELLIQWSDNCMFGLQFL